MQKIPPAQKEFAANSSNRTVVGMKRYRLLSCGAVSAAAIQWWKKGGETMKRSRFIFTSALVLVTASAYAATTTPLTLVNTDFTLSNPQAAPTNWTTNGPAGLSVNSSGSGPAVTLQLTHNMGNEFATAWTLLKARVPSFTMWADVEIDKPDLAQNCPADGVSMSFADVDPNAHSSAGGGTGLGYMGDSNVASQFIAFEINTYSGNAIDTGDCHANHNVTFAFDNIIDGSNRGGGGGSSNGTADMGGAKVGQVEPPADLVGKVLNGGWYRYQWNVDTTTGKMGAYVTGLDDSNKSVQNEKLVEVTFTGTGLSQLTFTGRWGVTAGTGGAYENVRVAGVKIVTPAVAPGPETAGE